MTGPTRPPAPGMRRARRSRAFGIGRYCWRMSHVAIIARLIAAVLAAAAVIGQLQTSIAFWSSSGVEHLWISIVNFFSFFTIESNLLGGAVFALGAALGIRRLVRRDSEPDPYWFTALRGAAVTYLVTTGIVYNLLLRGIELPQGSTLGWSNELLHAVLPAYALLDWLLAPGRTRLSWRSLWGMLAFPVIWAGYTLIRGPLTPNEMTGDAFWYPYPFLDPHTSANGYLSVSFYVLLIAAVIGLLAAGVIRISRVLPSPGERGGAAQAPDAGAATPARPSQDF